MSRVQKEWTRRAFLRNTMGTGSAMFLSPLLPIVSNQEDPILKLVNNTIGIDTHNHVEVPLNRQDFPGPNLDVLGEMKRSGLSAICMTFAVDYQKLTKEGEAYERFINGLDAIDELLKSNHMKRAFRDTDIQEAHNAKQPIVIQSVEGGHFLEGRLDRLETAYHRGLRHLGLLHDSDASVPLGDVYTNPPAWGGLTTFGKEVIRECNRLGILIDLTHCSNDTMDMALKASTTPVVVSHTGLDTQLGDNERMAKMMRPRLISKEQAKKVAQAGGVIGVWTHLADTPIQYAQNIRAMVEVVGIDHVCIGTDTKISTSGGPFTGNAPAPGPGNDHPDDQHNRPPGVNEPPPNNIDFSKRPRRMGERTNEAWPDQKEGFYYTVIGALLKTGFSEEEIAKIGGGNFRRVFDAATSGH